MIVCYLDETILKLVSHLCPLNGLQWVPRSLGSTVDEESGLRISHSSPFLTARQRHIWRCTHLRSTTYNNWQDINTLISPCLSDTDTTDQNVTPPTHTSYLSKTPQTCLCKKFLSGVNFSRLSEKMHIFDFFRDIFSVFGAFSRFFGCKIWFSKILSV